MSASTNMVLIVFMFLVFTGGILFFYTTTQGEETLGELSTKSSDAYQVCIDNCIRLITAVDSKTTSNNVNFSLDCRETCKGLDGE